MGRGTRIQSGRIAGIDLARFLAGAGMLAVHVGPTALTDPAGRVYAELTHGRASILFGLLAGIGVSLLARSRSASLGETRIRLLWQAALLLPLGLWLQSLDVTILVILSHYALLFALGALCAGLGARWLAGLAAVTVALGAVLFQLGRYLAPRTFDRSPAEWGDQVMEIAHVLAHPQRARARARRLGRVLPPLSAPSASRRVRAIGCAFSRTPRIARCRPGFWAPSVRRCSSSGWHSPRRMPSADSYGLSS